MPGSMSQNDLVADLKASLFDAASVFEAEGDAELKRFLAQALPDLQVKRPLTKLGTLTLVAGTAAYPVEAADFAALKFDLWRNPAKLGKPWDPCYGAPLPRLEAVRGADGGWQLLFDPAPSAAQIAVLGTACAFYYFATHAIGETAEATTVAVQDRGLLLLRAQAEAMLALAMRNAGKPVQMRDGLSGTPRNSTPAALRETLLRAFWEQR